MKIGNIVKSNIKGQVVIPKEIRDALGINENISLNLILAGQGIYLYPIKEVVTKVEGESSYLKLLEKTKGSWGKEKADPNRSKLELKASKERKKAW
jgi:AbrB family looped-hinge helix DNA binding protein